MTRFDAINLIRLFDFYLWAMLVLSFARRYLVYWDTIVLVVRFRGRWPKLIGRLKEHHGVLVTREVLRPLGLAVALTVTQMICSRVIFPQAQLTGLTVRENWGLLLPLVAAAVPMVGVDVYFLIRVGRFNRTSTEAYLDQAEHWLGTWKTPVIRVVTLGYVNPHRIVDTEVKKGLEQFGQTVSWVSWWVSLQVGLRVAFGLTIWLVWAYSSTW
ncbi:MAG: hypothetical protein U0871_20525 [Gemmataceae bacterium]